MNMLRRNKLKFRSFTVWQFQSFRVSGFQSFFVSCRRTYVLKKRTRELDESERAGKEKLGKGFLGA
jgi:hypothetical protein